MTASVAALIRGVDDDSAAGESTVEAVAILAVGGAAGVGDGGLGGTVAGVGVVAFGCVVGDRVVNVERLGRGVARCEGRGG